MWPRFKHNLGVLVGIEIFNFMFMKVKGDGNGNVCLVMFHKEEKRKMIFELQPIPSFVFHVFGQKISHSSIFMLQQ
jgi:hypothetical protein